MCFVKTKGFFFSIRMAEQLNETRVFITRFRYSYYFLTVERKKRFNADF